MEKLQVVFGSWKVRVTEPLLEADRRLRLFELPDQFTERAYSVLLSPELLRTLAPDAGTLFGPDIPLATVRQTETGPEVCHLLTRIDPHVAHLIRWGERAPASGDLLQDLCRAFDAKHLFLNNWECLYLKGLTDIELEQKYDIDQPFEYFTLCRQWWRELDDGLVEGFAPQLGDEIQYWSYDNHFCEIAPNAKGERGYVSIMQYGKRKNFWSEPRYTYKKKIFNEDSLERWERNFDNQLLENDPVEALTTFFGYPLRPLPQWRRSRLDLACEALDSGNLFMVNFDDCRIHGAPLPGGRLQQCEVEYLKSRSVPDRELIYRDLERLLAHVERFMRSQNLTFRRSNWSKLSFLRSYQAGAPRPHVADPVPSA